MSDTQSVSLGKRLRQERELRHWTQDQLAEKIGRSVPSINRWEHDRAEPQLDALKELTALFGKPPDRWGTSRWNVPFLRNPYFTGREHLLSNLHRSLSADKTVTLSQSRAISGLGGIGKTQIAIEYAYRYAREYEAVLWVQADSHEMLVSEFVRLAQILDLPDKEDKDQWRIVSAVKRWLQEHSTWLLILDNADDLAVIADVLPRGMGGATLVTTRSQVTGKIARSVSVEKMEMSEGIRFVLRRAKLLSEDEPLETVSVSTRTAAQQLVEELDGLPLALDQAGAYLEETGCSLSEYLTLYARHQLTLLKRESSMVNEYPYTVASTWTLSFAQVEQTDPAAADALRVCAFLHPDAIPQEILTAGAAVLGLQLQQVATEPLLLNEVIQLLRRYSLVKRDAEAKLLNMHRLVQVVLKESLGPSIQRLWAERAMLAVNAAFPRVEYSTWLQCERLLSQALTAAQLIEQYQIVSVEAGRLLYEAATYLSDRARLSEAEALYQQALHIREQSLGQEHHLVAEPLNGLAILHRTRGKYDQAEPLFQRALRIREQQLGPEHLLVAYSLHTMAILYLQQGKYAEAEALNRRALHIREQQLGPEHPDVALSLNNLAILYYFQGKYAEAGAFWQRALQVTEQQLGPEHPDVAYPLINLAELYQMQGKYDQAELLYQRALTIKEKACGPDHLDTALALDGLADLYYEGGKYAEAESLYQRVLQIREQHLGAENLDIAYPLIGLANLHREQGNYEQAELLYQQALHIREKSLGSQHSLVAHPLNNLAVLFYHQGRYAEAELLYQRALYIREQQLGLKDTLVSDTLNNLAELYTTQGRYAEAEPLYQRALHIRKQHFGPEHFKTTQTRTHLIALLHAMGHHEEAARLEAAQSEQRPYEEEQKTHPEE